jgi:hypothetical protein
MTFLQKFAPPNCDPKFWRALTGIGAMCHSIIDLCTYLFLIINGLATEIGLPNGVTVSRHHRGTFHLKNMDQVTVMCEERYIFSNYQRFHTAISTALICENFLDRKF